MLMAQFHYLTSTLCNALINIKFSDHYVDPRGNLRSMMDIENLPHEGNKISCNFTFKEFTLKE